MNHSWEGGCSETKGSGDDSTQRGAGGNRPEERFLEGPGTQFTVYKWPLPVDSTLHKGTRARGSAALKKWVCLFPIQKPQPLTGGEGRGSFRCSGQRVNIEGEPEGPKGGAHCALTRGRAGGKAAKSDPF